ncbi:hypothetical protein VQ02_10140 [Methylobacterium variabile]|jgi:hypothetical protein|uniref:Uncharacterized protein n=1 Tax=Methylobacterium variabile TaxID=298794 RepID=A0A0J6T099_9HYPH|nr:hypothetical protein [Methylobacterium variabile]KMO39292.1 hypothetical protein VQ02_10140 [Methylobacterium variabile]
MTPLELEQTILDLEEVRIVVRAPLNVQLGDYNYSRKAAGTASIAEWIEQRVAPIVGDYPVAVVDGSGISPNRRTKMATIRGTYVQ